MEKGHWPPFWFHQGYLAILTFRLPRDWLKMQCTWGQRSGKQNLEIMILKTESVPLVLPCSLRSVTTRSYCTLQGKLWGLAQEGSCSRIHHWRGWEKLIPTNSQSGQIQFFQEDPSNTHEVLAFHAPIVSPDDHLGNKKDGDWVWFRNTNDGCCWESTVGFFLLTNYCHTLWSNQHQKEELEGNIRGGSYQMFPVLSRWKNETIGLSPAFLLSNKYLCLQWA